jgi:hypothetical protein
VDVPLPLGLAFMELPTVGDVPGVAELAAGSPMTEPRPLGPPLFEPAWFGPACANARVLESASMLASAIDESFMIGVPRPVIHHKTNRSRVGCSNNRRSAGSVNKTRLVSERNIRIGPRR